MTLTPALVFGATQGHVHVHALDGSVAWQQQRGVASFLAASVARGCSSVLGYDELSKPYVVPAQPG